MTTFLICSVIAEVVSNLSVKLVFFSEHVNAATDKVLNAKTETNRQNHFLISRKK